MDVMGLLTGGLGMDGGGGEDRYGFSNRVSTFSRSQDDSKNVKQCEVLSVSIYERRFIEIE